MRSVALSDVRQPSSFPRPEGLLRPLPFPQSDRLVTILNTYPKAGVERDGSSLTNYYERRGNIAAFSSVSIFREGTEVVGETGSTQQEPVMRISLEFFSRRLASAR